MADNQNTLGTISDFSVLAERLMIKNGNKQTEKLNKNIEGLNKSILAFAKKVLPNSGIGETISGISSNRRTFDTFGDMLRNRMFGVNRERTFKGKFGNVRSALDTFGVVKKGSGSLFDELLEKRDVKNQFISDQLKVNPQMADTPENRKTFGKKFDIQQKIQKELNTVQGEIDRLKNAGFTDKQISRSGLVKQRDSAAARLAASDNRLYGKIKDEMMESIKGGIIDGIVDAAKEAREELKKADKEDARLRRTDNPLRPKQSEEELISEQEQIQKGILDTQNELLETVKDIQKAIDHEPEPVVEKKESIFGGWLKGILGTVSNFFMSRITGLVGMLTSGISAVLSPILKFLGIGKAAQAVGNVAGKLGTAGAVAGGAAAAKTAGTITDKIKGLVKSVAPRIPAAARLTAGLLLSKPAMIAAAVVGAGSLGYSMLSDENKKSIDDKIAKIFGNDAEDKIAKNVKDEQIKIEKVNSRIGDILERKTQEVREITNKKTETATIINSPTTNNNSSSVVNNHIKSNPRNNESTYNRYVNNRYSLA